MPTLDPLDIRDIDAIFGKMFQLFGYGYRITQTGATLGSIIATGLDALASAGDIAVDTTIAAGKKLIFAAGAGGIDASLATGAFQVGASSATLGFLGATAIARPSAYTMTYNTAVKTSAAVTSNAITDSSGGTASTSTIAAITTGGAAADQAPTANAIATLAAELALTKADLLATKKLLVAVITDLKSYGLLA